MLRIKKDLYGREVIIFDHPKIVKVEEVGYERTMITFEDGSKMETRNTLDDIMNQIDNYEEKKDEIGDFLMEMLSKSFGLH